MSAHVLTQICLYLKILGRAVRNQLTLSFEILLSMPIESRLSTSEAVFDYLFYIIVVNP